MTTKRTCERLAATLGCRLEIFGRHVTIWLPRGMQVAGNPGLDCLCNDGETLADVWPNVQQDLRNLADDGMEPLAA